MSDKNMAKEWQRGWYQVNVCGNSVRVSTMHNGKRYAEFSHCHPDDGFSLSEGVKIAMERLEQAINPDAIKVGDRAKIKSLGGIYHSYYDWIAKNVTDVKDAACWVYSPELPICPNINHKYCVKYIAPHGSQNTTLAFIMDCNYLRGYVYDINALEKINE